MSSNRKQRRPTRRNGNRRSKPRATGRAAPVARASLGRTRAPRQRFTPSGALIISHSEYVDNIAVNTAGFHVLKQYRLNPGNAALHPWLADIAAKYETYRYTSLTFEFKSRAASTTPGSVMFSPEYDPSDDAPTSLREAMAASDSKENSLWTSMRVALRPKRMYATQPRKLVRAIPTGVFFPIPTDIQQYDSGKFYVITNLAPAIVQSAPDIGSLWVHYTVRFETPQATPNTFVDATVGATTVYSLPSDTPLIASIPESVVNLFANLAPAVDRLKLGTMGATGEIELPPGRFEIEYDIEGEGVDSYDEKEPVTNSFKSTVQVDGATCPESSYWARNLGTKDVTVPNQIPPSFTTSLSLVTNALLQPAILRPVLTYFLRKGVGGSISPAKILAGTSVRITRI